MTYIEGDSWVHRLDPRIKTVIAFAFALFIAVSRTFSVQLLALGLAVLLAASARLPGAVLWRRLWRINLFMLLLWLFLPWTTPGETLFRIGALAATREGVLLALSITVKGQAIVLIYTALLSTIELTTLGHALIHLRVPEKLAHLFLFTIRYMDVLHHEYERLARAIKMRCFRPGFNLRTCRAYGYLLAMLLAGSLDRSQRVVAAMKCRGYHGKFYLLDHFHLNRRDALFSLASALLFFLLAGTEVLWPLR
jgi:cobalt/nickel transport system permease protein